ncbi:MAG: M48 family metallopeptidase [Lachnospiraceae bacterium]|nr:M48 family metallopeptidase [Lachnospiraceae bacterium]
MPSEINENIIEYRLMRSRRRTISVEVTDEGVTVRAPLKMSVAEIDKFVIDHKDWIRKKTALLEEKKKNQQPVEHLTRADIDRLADEAMRVIPERVAYYAPLVGVTYGRITIRNQVSRWGSCSSKGNLNFNCLLMLTPPEVLDSVVVHELCHRKEMNHSKKFYAEVLRVYPDYHKWQKWLETHGDDIMRRMTG